MAKAAKRHSSKPELSFAHKIVNGAVIVPILYYGKHAGHGTYIAGAIQSGDKQAVAELVRDNDGKPVPYAKL